jgi:serine/threonine protein phosphatase PrpC
MEVSLFAVFDGHGGSETAQYASNNISRFFTSALCRRQGVAEIPQAIGTALEQAFVEMDAELGRQPLMKVCLLVGHVSDEPNTECR